MALMFAACNGNKQQAVKIMAMTQLSKELTDQQAQDIVVFLASLTGQVPADAQQAPAMP